jgi:hypothetical protein
LNLISIGKYNIETLKISAEWDGKCVERGRLGGLGKKKMDKNGEKCAKMSENSKNNSKKWRKMETNGQIWSKRELFGAGLFATKAQRHEVFLYGDRNI